MEMRKCSAYPCGGIGVGVGAACLSGGEPPGPAPIAFDVTLPLCSPRKFSLFVMAYCPSDPVPHCGNHSHSVSTVNAESAPVVRQSPRTSMGGPEKSSVDCSHNHPKCPFRVRNPGRRGLERNGETVLAQVLSGLRWEASLPLGLWLSIGASVESRCNRSE